VDTAVLKGPNSKARQWPSNDYLDYDGPGLLTEKEIFVQLPICASLYVCRKRHCMVFAPGCVCTWLYLRSLFFSLANKPCLFSPAQLYPVFLEQALHPTRMWREQNSESFLDYMTVPGSTVCSLPQSVDPEGGDEVHPDIMDAMSVRTLPVHRSANNTFLSVQYVLLLPPDAEGDDHSAVDTPSAVETPSSVEDPMTSSTPISQNPYLAWTVWRPSPQGSR
jgi:hypothetical protein